MYNFSRVKKVCEYCLNLRMPLQAHNFLAIKHKTIYFMQKQIYSSPATDIIELSAESSILTLSSAVEMNKYYDLYYGGEDGEFE